MNGGGRWRLSWIILRNKRSCVGLVTRVPEALSVTVLRECWLVHFANGLWTADVPARENRKWLAEPSENLGSFWRQEDTWSWELVEKWETEPQTMKNIICQEGGEASRTEGIYTSSHDGVTGTRLGPPPAKSPKTAWKFFRQLFAGNRQQAAPHYPERGKVKGKPTSIQLSVCQGQFSK